MIKISEGLTYEYVIPGVFIMFVGLLLSIANVFFILIVILGLMFVMVSSGVLIDTETKRIKKYRAIGSINLRKPDDWVDLKKLVEIKLKYNTNEGTTYRPIYLAKAPSTLTTYDLHFTDEFNNKLLLYDFKDLRQALKTMSQLEKLSNASIINEVKDNIQSKLNNRKRRR